jgi:hypothetical protein
MRPQLFKRERNSGNRTRNRKSPSAWRRLLRLETLEDRRLLALVNWTGGGGDLLWSNPLNWSTSQLPGIEDDVVINAPSGVTVSHNNGASTIKSLASSNSVMVTGGNLTVSGSLTIASGNSLIVRGTSVSFVGAGTSSIDGVSLIAENGTLTISSLASYANTSSSGSVQFLASGMNSLLDLPQVTSITNATGRHQDILLTAEAGGEIRLPKLTELVDPNAGDTHGRAILIRASGTDSRIAMPLLASFTDLNRFGEIGWDGAGDTGGMSSITTNGGGVVSAPLLRNLNAVALMDTASTTLPIGQFTSFTNGQIIANGVTAEFTSLTNADGTRLYATDGGTLFLPALTRADGARLYALDGGRLLIPLLTSYVHTTDGSVQFLASGTNSLIDLPQLTSITNATGRHQDILLTAETGGEIRLRKLTELVDPNAGDTHGRAILIRASGTDSLISMPLLASFIDLDPNGSGTWDGAGDTLGMSSITTTGGGIVSAPLLRNLNAVALMDTASTTLPIGQFTSFTNGQIIANGLLAEFTSLTNANGTRLYATDGGILFLPALTRADGARLYALDGGRLLIPLLTSYVHTTDGSVQFLASGTNSLIDLPQLTSITNATGRHQDILLTAETGGEIRLPKLTELVDPNAGDTHGRAILIRASGTDSLISMPLLASFIDLDPNGSGTWDGAGDTLGMSSITTTGGGIVSAPLLRNLNAVALMDTASTTLPISQFTSFTNGQIVTNGVTTEFGNLTNASGTRMYATDGGILSLPALTSADGARLYALDGGRLLLPLLTSYVHTTDGSVQFLASGTNSVIDLPQLTSITNGTGRHQDVLLTAETGGEIRLPKLTDLIDPNVGDTQGRAILIRATGADSVISMPLLASFIDQNPYGDGTWDGAGDTLGMSSITTTGGGLVSAPLLRILNAVALMDTASTTLPISQFTTFTNGQIVANGVLADFTSLTNANGTRLYATDGGTLSLPALMSYTHTVGGSVQFLATGTNSILDLPQVTTITNGTGRHQDMLLTAEAGGEIRLPKLTDLIDPNVGDTQGRAILIRATGADSVISMPLLASFIDQNPYGDGTWDGAGDTLGMSSITTTGGGLVSAPLLRNLNAVALMDTASTTLPIGQFTTFTNGQIVANGVLAEFAA